MSSAPHKLPAAMGSSAALAVAFVGFMRQIPPVTCVGRAVCAFAVFAAIGIVIRYLLDYQPGANIEEGTASSAANSTFGVTIQPGTQVSELIDDAEDVPRRNAA